MIYKTLLILAALSYWQCGLALVLASESDVPAASFKNQVASILLDNCVACHGPKKAEGGYRIDTFDELVKPGDTGALPIDTAAANHSELLRRLTSSDPSERMPSDTAPLSGAQIDLVKRWVEQGAKFDGEKSSVPLNLVIPPRVYADPPATYSVPTPLTAIAFSPDGSQLLVGGYHELTVWNVADGAIVRRIKNFNQRIHSIIFLADQKTIAVGGGEPGRNGEVRLVDFESETLKGVVGRTGDVVLDLAMKPGGSNELAVASADGLIKIFDATKFSELRSISNHADWVTAVAWSEDGSRLASASRDKTSKVFDASNGELLATYLGHAAPVRGVSFLPDGKQVVSSGADKKIHRWEVEGAKKVTEVAVGGEAFKLVQQNSLLFAPCSDTQLRRIDLATNQVSHSLSGYTDWVVSTAMHPGTNCVAGGAMNGEVRLWNATDGSLIRSWIAKP